MTATLFINAHLLDPAQGLDEIGQLRVEKGKIAAIGRHLPVAGAEVIDLQGQLLTPGWIDIHTHVFTSVGDFCLPADEVGIRSGVTTVVDAGTSGTLTFPAFRETVAQRAQTRVYGLIDPSLLYIATSDFIAHRLGFAVDPKNQDLDRARQVIEEQREIIVGFKARPTVRIGETESPTLTSALILAEEYHLPIMIHLGRFPMDGVLDPSDLLDRLRPGDIVTHTYQPRFGLFDAEGSLLPAARRALDRGVLLDVGHSGSDFSFNTARLGLDQGIRPHTLSTDLNIFNTEIVVDLATTLSKFLALGLTLPEVIQAVTSAAARAIQKNDELGSLQVGREADLTVAELVAEEAELVDGRGGTLSVSQMLKVRGVCRAGQFQKIAHTPYALPPLAGRQLAWVGVETVNEEIP
ncbi:MAG: amidohydrolase/deacetylase family metallohydrolase [Thermostichus sp. BF3_bins_97]